MPRILFSKNSCILLIFIELLGVSCCCDVKDTNNESYSQLASLSH